MNKLAELNKMEVIDFSCSGSEVEYIAVENNEQNREILKSLGATEEVINDMTSEFSPEELDITYFAFAEMDATMWSEAEGFTE